MAETKDNKSIPPETQHERWIKYGANVAITSLIVIALAVLLTWLAQSHAERVDTTVGETQSLRPQTVNVIKELKEPVRIVALYPRLKSDPNEQDSYQPVADLLNEYATKGKNITTEMLDPDTEKDAFNKLVGEVTNKYGGEVKAYKAFLDDVPAQSTAADKFLIEEAGRFHDMPVDKIADQQLREDVTTGDLTLVLMHLQLRDLKKTMDSELDQQVPSYKDIVDDVRTTYSTLSQNLQQFSLVLNTFRGNNALPKELQEYGPAAAARADLARKPIDAILDRITHLPEIKELDEFKEQLKSTSIIVMSDSGYKILSFRQVWQKAPEASRFMPQSADVPPKMTFAGEQQITAAIVSLTTGKKPMVVFVRTAGPPWVTMTDPQQQPLLASVGQRLRDYNFDVQEKDMSGQPPSQEMPMPEPTPEQMKSAIWVVVRTPQDSQPGEPSMVDAMLAEHLKSGGAAMVMLIPTADPMEQALMPMGIRARTDSRIVHETLSAPERQSTDLVDSAFQSNQILLKLNHYGDHPIAEPLEGLDFLQLASCPIMVEATPPPGVKVTPLLPMPLSPHYWAPADAQSLLSGDHADVKFNPNPDPEHGREFGDIDNTASNPLYGAAASEGPGGSRLVVVGSFLFARNDLVDLPNQEMWDRHGLKVARLPGNEEFFVNSILWLAHEDSMLAISPHALQVARIKDMSPAVLEFWRVGILTVGLPLAAIVAGLMVYVKRRD